MKNVLPEISVSEKRTDQFGDNEDYYFENGLMVLTARFLWNRAYCCDDGCRHCPFRDRAGTAQSK
jgi:hypothetical protein